MASGMTFAASDNGMTGPTVGTKGIFRQQRVLFAMLRDGRFALLNFKGVRVGGSIAVTGVFWNATAVAIEFFCGKPGSVVAIFFAALLDALGTGTETLHNVVGTNFIRKTAIGTGKSTIAFAFSIKAMAVGTTIDGTIFEGTGVDGVG